MKPEKIKNKKCVKVKRNGERCKNTRIPGSRFCTNHGAFNPNSKRCMRNWKGLIKTGENSKHLLAGPKVTKLVEEVRRNNKYLDIDENIAIMTTIMKGALENAEKQGGFQRVVKKSKKFFWMLEKIQKGLLTKAKIEEGLKHKIDIETIEVAMIQLMNIVKKEVDDPITLRRIADRFSRVRVHDMPVHGHKPRDDYLMQQENMDNNMKLLRGTVESEMLEDKPKKKKRR